MKKYCKLCAIILVVLLNIVFLYACSNEIDTETTEDDTTGFITDFYKITDENKVLSIDLDTDPSSGYYWTYVISDETILNLTSFGYNPGTEEANDAKWSSTFAAPSNKSGNVTLSLYYVENLEDVENTEPAYIMNIDVSMNGKIAVKSITK